MEIKGNLYAGAGSSATGATSFAFGNNVTASGDASHAEGLQTTASGDGSHAEGGCTNAIGLQSHAEGYLTIAQGDYSHAEGYGNIASGEGSHAEGGVGDDGYYPTSATTKSSHAEGFNTLSSGFGSHAEGANTKATGDYSHSEGGSTTASGQNSHAEGYQTTASGDASHAEGLQTTASNQNSHAEGAQTTASGQNSHAEGYQTTASGQSSHSGGFNSSAMGDYSFVHGSNSVALSANTIVFGDGITGTSSNTVYVPNLNVGSLGTGTSVNNLGIDSNGFVVSGLTSTDTNFANTNLTFTGNRSHNTDGNELEITTDNGGFSAGFIYVNNTLKSEFGFGPSYTDWRSTSVDHYLSGVKRLEILSSETVLNNPGGDFNFRVEGDTDTHLLFVDAGTDEIGVGTNNPLGKLHIQTTENLPVLVVDGLRGTTTLGKRQHYTAQADTVTAGVGTSNIASIPMVSSERMTLTGKITAFFGDVTVGGTFIAVAKCSGSTVSIVGTVGTSIRSENSAGTPSFTVVGSGSNVVIQVTGGGEDLTWLCTYEYQIVSPPAS